MLILSSVAVTLASGSSLEMGGVSIERGTSTAGCGLGVCKGLA